MPQIDLSGLKNIHLPLKPDFFPPATGWWLVGFGIICCCFLLLWIGRIFYFSPKAYALRELAQIRRQKYTSVACGKALSALLKRVALYQFGAKKTASLSEEKWSTFLQSAAPKVFSQDEANFIAFSTYLPDNQIRNMDLAVIIQHTAQWIRTVMKRKKHGNQDK